MTKRPKKISKVRVLVYGGRTAKEADCFLWLVQNGEATVRDMIRKVDPEIGPYRIEAIVHGGAEGADKAGGRWARFLGVREMNFEAEFRFAGNSAGPMRNRVMADRRGGQCLQRIINKGSKRTCLLS